MISVMTPFSARPFLRLPRSFGRGRRRRVGHRLAALRAALCGRTQIIATMSTLSRARPAAAPPHADQNGKRVSCEEHEIAPIRDREGSLLEPGGNGADILRPSIPIALPFEA